MLVIDSNPINQFLANAMLDRLQVTSALAENLNTALQIVQAREDRHCCRFGLVLLNVENALIDPFQVPRC